MKILLHTLFFFLLITQICIAQWYQQASGTNATLNSVHFEDANNGWAVGDSGIILHTTNGGQDWIAQTSGTPHVLYGVSFSDTDNGTAVGHSLLGGGGTILRTTDGGQNWIDQPSGLINIVNFYGVAFTDANNGTAVGETGTILRTTDGGQNWITQICGTTTDLYGVSFTDENNGTVAGGGYNGGIYNILRTSDGGENWIIQKSGDGGHVLFGVSFSDTNNGTVVGGTHLVTSYGLIFNTTDGGANWLRLVMSPNWLYNVSCFDANNRSAVGMNGTILRTTDGGQNWVSQISGTANHLYGVCFTDANTGWAVGENGIVLHTTNGGVSFVEEEQLDEIPTEFLISQNYPNPFNPSTKIKYSVPQSSNIILKVFDVLGNEIETLVNEEKPAGTYEVTWYADGLPSGVYFYQLKASNYIETKKMLLLK